MRGKIVYSKREDAKDTDWVPRKTYDMVMDKLNAAVEENHELKSKLRRCMNALANDS